MNRVKVRIPQDVEKQILDQVLYIASDSIDNALAWEERLRKAIIGIGDLPGHPIDPDARDRVGETIRKLLFERTYLIHYRINQTTKVVEIVNFRHCSRLPRKGEA